MFEQYERQSIVPTTQVQETPLCIDSEATEIETIDKTIAIDEEENSLSTDGKFFYSISY